jgi:hypothetical protein
MGADRLVSRSAGVRSSTVPAGPALQKRARWPDLFVVGAPRAGTSSLADYLDQHPQIFMSRLKEPHFFTDMKPDFLPVVSDEQAYLRLFGRAEEDQLLGEASPTYLADPTTPGRIFGANRQARILIVLRDPVARAYSGYWHSVRYGRERRPFLDAIRAGADLDDPRLRHPSTEAGSWYLRAGQYPAHVKRYLETFGDRVLVLLFEELTVETRTAMRRTFEFLGVDADVADRVRLPVRNAGSLPRNPLFRRLYRSARVRAAGRRVVPASLQPPLERVLLRRGGFPPMDPEARRLLEEFYAPEGPALERLLGRALPWASAGTGGG